MLKLLGLIAAIPMMAALAEPAIAADPPLPVWYYCTNPAGYFPSVNTCKGRWLQGRIPAATRASAPGQVGAGAPGQAAAGAPGAPGQAAGAPGSAAAAAPDFQVLFNYDSSALTADGRRAVDRAVELFRRNRAETIKITGYTDLAGAQPYNLPLSERRTAAIRQYLVDEIGLLTFQVDDDWRGMKNPRVATAPGIKEPLNRRVEIFVR